MAVVQCARRSPVHLVQQIRRDHGRCQREQYPVPLCLVCNVEPSHTHKAETAMKNLLLGVIAGLVLIASGTARAADVSAAPVLKAPPAAPAIANWSGLYVGGHAGGAFSRDVMTFTDDTGLAEDFRFSPRSFIGGG